MVDLSKLGIKVPKKENEDAANNSGHVKVVESDQGSQTSDGPDETTAGDNGSKSAQVRGSESRPTSSGASLLARLNTNRKESTVPAGDVRTDSSGQVPDGVVHSNDPGNKPAATNGSTALAALLKRNPSGGSSVADSDQVDPPAVQAPSALDTQTEEVIPPGPDGFKYRLDMLDALIKRDAGISDVMLGMIKTRIKDVVKELKEFPEYDGLIIDRDIHNIMLFMQKSVSVAKEGFVEKEKKRVTKAARAAKFDFGDVGSGPALQLEGPTLNLDALSEMNLDNVKAKVR